MWHRLESEEGADGPGPPLALVRDDAELDKLCPQPGLVPIDSQRLRLGVLQGARLLDDAAERAQLREIEREPRAVVEDEVFLVRGEGGEQTDQRHGVPVDRHVDPEVEPVEQGTVVARGGNGEEVVGLGVSRRHRDDRGCEVLGVGEGAALDRDFDVIAVLQHREHVAPEAHRVHPRELRRDDDGQPSQPGFGDA